MLQSLETRFKQVLPRADYCSLRMVHEADELLTVRQDVPQPMNLSADVGAMITVIDKGGLGYAATCDLSTLGLVTAVKRAHYWARNSAGRSVVDFAKLVMPHSTGRYESPEHIPWDSLSPQAKFDLLVTESRRLKIDKRIVDWEASLWRTKVQTLLLTSAGGRVEQRFCYLSPLLRATANEGADTENRSLGGGRGYVRQGGLEILDHIGYRTLGPRVAQEAIELLTAPNCPTGAMDLLLAPDQMILQIHESIGHPLELDRILGDERNYAGTSFVTQDMIGSYRYGSDLLNITFDPTRREEFASYAFDDDGRPATKEFLIEKGVLKRVLGGVTSQARTGLSGVSNSRACSWNRPPIDRMANLNLEPGRSSIHEMIAAVKRGVYMKTNCSWSIDDSRNKFQFGCEYAQFIEDGRLTNVVKKPNYRGISATFWRNPKMTGGPETVDVLGSPFCGKGEPNQCVRVGHSSPACLFENVEVFGGQ